MPRGADPAITRGARGCKGQPRTPPHRAPARLQPPSAAAGSTPPPESPKGYRARTYHSLSPRTVDNGGLWRALEQDCVTSAYSECAKVTQSPTDTPIGYPAGRPQATILPPQELHSRRSQEDWRLVHRGTDSVSASQHRVARRRQPGVPRPQTAFVTKTGFFPRNQTGWQARPIL